MNRTTGVAVAPNTEASPAVVGFVDEGIGHTSYLVDLGDGTALVIDPRRIPEL